MRIPKEVLSAPANRRINLVWRKFLRFAGTFRRPVTISDWGRFRRRHLGEVDQMMPNRT